MLARPRTAAWRWATAAAIAGSVALSADAHAALTEPGSVRAGHNVSVFHEIDFVATFGHQVGTPLRVEVFRGPHLIARAAGPAVSTPEGGGLEVNHGPEGAPVAGDCWSKATADIKPYDKIVVTDAAGGTDTILVDDIVVESGPEPDPANPDDIVLTGRARSALGGPIADELEAEFRLTSSLRGGPARIERDGETFKAVYTPPYTMLPDKGGRATPAQLMHPDAEHTIGFGHTFPFATGETQIADAGSAPGPAIGCEGLAPAAPDANAATAVDRDVVGAGAGLEVSGTATATVDGVTVTLDDGPGGADPIEKAASALTAADGAPAGADRAWTVAFGAEEVATFGANANLTATPAFSGGGATTAPGLRVGRDTVAPAAPQSSPAAGRYEATQFVDLFAEPGTVIHYTTDASVPTEASARYTGFSLTVNRTTTIRAIAIDAAGNVSPVATLAFTIVAPGTGTGTGTAPVPLAAPVPGLASVAAQAPAVSAVAGVTLRATRLSAPARLSARAARRNGVVASFVAPRGAEYAEARLYRLAGARRTLVARKTFATSAGRRDVARFTSAAVRRKLKAGRYVLEVRTGPELTRLGPAVVRSLRIAR
ncbi:MAG TPA: chitobiase/beta-hexosaminidase C-terminal domain-containing protein [Solirubrobacteraceae bacterium]|nr:chitobiase/beta-hexosaminidase C-terminal domain-containing protein [Solirubrobacteraceae bacterium]